MSLKLRFGKRQLCMTVGASVGALVALFSQSVSVGRIAYGFAHAFPARFSLAEISNALLWQFLPLLLLYFSGFMLICRAFDTLVLSLRALICGFVCVMLLKTDAEKDALFFIVFFMFVLFEAVTLALMNSMGRLAEMFFLYSAAHSYKTALLKYSIDQLFFCGAAILLYLMRGSAVLLFGK